MSLPERLLAGAEVSLSHVTAPIAKL